MGKKNKYKVPYVDLALQFKSFQKEMRPRWEDILNSGQFLRHTYTQKLERSLAKFLTKRGIATHIHYPLPIHKQPAFKNYIKINLPVSESVSKQILSLPIFPQITARQQNYVIESIHAFFKK